MNKGTGFVVFIAAALAAVRFASGPSPSSTQVPRTAATSKVSRSSHAVVENKPTHGGCAAFTPETAADKLKPYPRHADTGVAASLVDGFVKLPSPSVHFAIALAPDPRHTELGVMFDRQMVAIQQAAQDEGYSYDSSWLPWSSETSAFQRLDDQQLQDDLIASREACPGIFLFRKSSAKDSAAAYASGLLVLIVGEKPTGGINQDQWDNAIDWIRLKSTPRAASDTEATSLPDLRILGPTFSGSMVSFDRDLRNLPAGAFPHVQALSGSISSCRAVQWFRSVSRLPRTVDFGSFQENDELQIQRFLDYWTDRSVPANETAILSEDETAYGDQYQADHNKNPAYCEPDTVLAKDVLQRPLRLYYPRDLSALRAQYQKESVFTTGSPSGERQIHSVLQEGAEPDDTRSGSDTIASFSGHVTPLTQESVLYGLVTELRTHHVHNVLLRCTNPLDFLFLTRFLHRAYPQGSIVLVGSDLLLRREIDTTEFRGVMGLTNYPLIPRDEHWSLLTTDPDAGQPHSHRVFESQTAEGTYLAGRYTFEDRPEPGTGDSPHAVVKKTGPRVADKKKPKSAPALPKVPVAAMELSAAPPPPVVFRRKNSLPAYANPFWFDRLRPAPVSLHAPTWLTVVGRDGFWPIAVLTEKPTASTLVDLIPGSDLKPPRLDFDLPLPWRIAALLAFGLLAYQLKGLWPKEQYPSTGLFSVFRTTPEFSQQVLMGICCFVVTLLLLEIGSLGLSLPSLDLLKNSAAIVFAGVTDTWLPCIAALAMLVLLWSPAWLTPEQLDPIPRKRPIAAIVVLSALFLVALAVRFFLSTQLDDNVAARVPLFYRLGHLTSGVSPLVPVLLLSIGFYLWIWQAMAGNYLLLPAGRPHLPKLADDLYVRIGHKAEARITSIASPVTFRATVWFPPLVVGAVCVAIFWNDLPLIGLEGHSFSFAINAALLAALLIALAESSRLYWTWIELRRLLNALGRLRLRRTFTHLRAVPASSLWSVSGSVQIVQHNFFVQQLDAADRLLSYHCAATPCLQLAVDDGKAFQDKYLPSFEAGLTWDQPLNGKEIRIVFNDAVREVMEDILVPHWETEHTSLVLEDASGDTAGKKESGTVKSALTMALSRSPVIQAAEEFVCLHYVAFIQNILARIRTMVLSMVCLFIAVCVAISFYPFVPRTEIGVWMMVDLAIIASAVIYVYMGMERDETLSYITNTPPGQLGPEFWLKTATFLAGPLLGLLTTQFPAIADSVLTWVQPGLDAFK